MAKTIQLTHDQITEIILETYKEITDKNFVWNALKKTKFHDWETLDEQAEYYDGMMYLDPNQSMEANMSEVKRLQGELEDRTKTVEDRYPEATSTAAKGGNLMTTHLILDIVAAIAYIAGAITSVAGVGLILISIAIVIDLFNAYLYYTEEDYFMAGLMASFIIIPFVNLAPVKLLFGKALSKVAAFANKLYKAKAIKVSAKEIVQALGRETTAAMAMMLKKNPLILKAAKSAVPKLEKIIKAFTQFINWIKKANSKWYYDWIIPDWVIYALGKLKGMLKFVKATIKLVVMILAEMMMYDPSVVGTIADWVGFPGSVADWFNTKPKYLLALWSNTLAVAGNKRGAMTTTPYDCNKRVYTWDDITIAFKRDYPNRPSTSERRIWEKWTEDNWRPLKDSKGVVGDVGAETYFLIKDAIKEYPNLKSELYKIDRDFVKGVLESCYTFSRAINSKDEDTKDKIGEIVTKVVLKICPTCDGSDVLPD